MLTIVTTTRDNIEWVECFIQSTRKTATNKEIPIIIIDNSSNAEYKKLISIVSKYNNVSIRKGITSKNRYEIDSWVRDWNEGIKHCTTEFIVFCHIDIVFFYSGWDQVILENLNTYSLISGTFTPSNDEYLEEFDGYRILSCFIASTTKLLTSTNFATLTYYNDAGNKIYVENGNISLAAKKQGPALLLKKQTIKQKKNNIYGDIFYYKEFSFFYHCTYSSRIKKDSTCPVPEQEYNDSKLADRNIEDIPNFLLTHVIGNNINIETLI
jgi:hypothetical protein